MVDIDYLECLISRKQAHRPPRLETAREIYCSPCNAEDTFGYVTLADLYRINQYTEKRKLNFLRSEAMQVRRVSDGKAFASLEEALPMGRARWKLINCYCSVGAKLMLQLVPISEELTSEAERHIQAITDEWRLDECEECTVFDEEETAVECLLDEYAVELELTGSYTVFMEAEDGSGEYICRENTTKPWLHYVEIAQDTKIVEHILTEGESMMKTIRYYT